MVKSLKKNKNQLEDKRDQKTNKPRIIRGWDEHAYYLIAKESGSKQTLNDVKYARMVFHKVPRAEYAERIDEDAFILCYSGDKVFRIIGMATRKEAQGRGYGGVLLRRAISYARAKGYESICTLTNQGVGFYQRNAAFEVKGKKGTGEFELEMRL